MTTYPDVLPSDDDELDYSVLERYWLGETTQDETVHIEAWLAVQPGRRAWYEQMRRGLKGGQWVPLERSEVSLRTDAVFRRAGIDTQPGVRGLSFVHQIRARLPRLGGWYAMSSLLVGVVMLGAGWIMKGARVNASLASHASTYATANGERATITLPDGSTVILNVGSQLHVPANYATGNRTVQLMGEALFTVTNHSGTPFTVEAGRSVTRVLGTQFVVRHYATDTAALVAVREGRVMVQSAVLTKDQQISVGENGAGAVRSAQAEQFAFSTGVLALTPMPIGGAIADLNRWYNADIRLGDVSLQYERISGRFSAGSISDLIDHLEWTFNLRVVREGRVLTLYRKS